MRKILLSLILILAISGFVIAESTSNIRTDFYVSALSADSSEQNSLQDTINLRSLITYGIATLIALAVIVTVSQRVLKSKMKRSPKPKKARRKK
ncbi:hypothetical protein KAJ38_00370 [Candidatus Pacearchaeota archaeon]|nr:hypothetical protein [Candidatus Pacearchaeota archaeon]